MKALDEPVEIVVVGFATVVFEDTAEDLGAKFDVKAFEELVEDTVVG